MIPDNDKAGRAHAALVYEVLKDVANSVSVLELPGLPEKGDVSDWIAVGGTKEDQVQMLEDLDDADTASGDLVP